MSEYDKCLSELASMGIMPQVDEVEQKKQAQNNEDRLIQEMERRTGLVYTPEQARILKHHGSGVILACAGSGKTTVLTNLLAKRIMNGEETDPSKILCTTFSVDGAAELQKRLKDLLKLFGVNSSVDVKTFHSFCIGILRDFGYQQAVIDQGTRMKFISEAIKDAGIRTKGDETEIIDQMISYQVNKLISDKEVVDNSINTIQIDVQKYREVRVGYERRKVSGNYIDFDDMQMYLFKWLVIDSKSEDASEREMSNRIRNYCKYKYSSYYIDEAQDLSKLQYKILEALASKAGTTDTLDSTLLFIGDDDQCIYEWRGADPSIILTVGTQFGIDTFPLSENYRCKDNIVQYAARSIRHNGQRYKKSIYSSKEGGNIEYVEAENGSLFKLSEKTYEKIKGLMANGVNLKDIAVLARNNFHLAILNNMLMLDGVYTDIPKEMRLSKSMMFRDIEDIIGMLTGSNTVQMRASERVLWKMCQYLSTANSKWLSQLTAYTGLSLIDCIGAVLYYGGMKYKVKDYFDPEEANVPHAVVEQIISKADRLYPATRESLCALYMAYMSGKNQSDSVLRVIEVYFGMSTGFLYKTAEQMRNVRGMCDYFSYLVNKHGFDKAIDILKMTRQFENGDIKYPSGAITLTTLHRSKGREWQNVIIFACDNISLPNFDGIRKLNEANSSIQEVYSLIEESRRLYYVGCTRAKNSLYVVCGPEIGFFTLESRDIVAESEKNRINNTILDFATGRKSYGNAINQLKELNKL